MKRLVRNTAAKVLAGLLAILCAAMGTLFVTVIVQLGDHGAYYLSEQDYIRNLMYQDVYDDIENVAQYYSFVLSETDWAEDFVEAYQSIYSPYYTNFFFRVMDYDTGEVLLTSYTDDALLHMGTERYVAPADAQEYYFVEDDGSDGPRAESSAVSYSDSTDPEQSVVAPAGETPATDPEQAGPSDHPRYTEANPRHVIISAYLRRDLTTVQDNYSHLYNVGQMYYSLRGGVIVFAAVSWVAFLALSAFLCIGAGLRQDNDEVHMRRLDRLPWDLLIAGGLALGGLIYLMDYRIALGSVAFYGLRWAYQAIYLIILGGILAALFLAVVMSLGVRAKVPGSGKNCAALRIGRALNRWLDHPMQRLKDLMVNLPVIWKSVLLLLLYLALEVLCVRVVWLYSAHYPYRSLIPLTVLNVAMLIFCLRHALSLRRLQIASHAIAEGDLNYQVDPRYLSWYFRRQGADLSRISAGLAIAVEERTKSEHLKTELITNVSHDLKTPLTSIVNYADLLSRVPDLPPEAVEYVQVLQRQAARLKKLTEDLVEASKASTGNLPVELTELELGEMLLQVAGEYEERLEQAGLIPVLQLPEEPIMARCDGRYLWRILDNLLSNVRKYALPGTRVYIFLSEERDQAVISIKNISREQLSVGAEELLERFTRGDSSRNTEGSGLGLSIALSLAQLMGGDLSLTVDGDLFKAEIRLQKAN